MPHNNIAQSKNSVGQVVLFKNKLEVRLVQDTVWLSLNQMAALFERDKSVVSRHLRNIFKEKELRSESTVAFFATVQKEGSREVERNVEFYNLDAIISVGYRVNSKRGIQFRIWATGVLRQHLIQGYTLNERRLNEQTKKFRMLQQAIKLIGNIKDKKELAHQEALGLLDVISDYSYALELLDAYDYDTLRLGRTSRQAKFTITYAEAKAVISQLKKKFGGSDLFGKEKDASLQSSLAAIYQTFDAKELYPSVEEKAANLLYFIVKNHSFIDGNKRIAAAIFLWFLERNGLLYKEDGSKRIADNALVALTLLIAESDPAERETIVRLVVNLINRDN